MRAPAMVSAEVLGRGGCEHRAEGGLDHPRIGAVPFEQPSGAKEQVEHFCAVLDPRHGLAGLDPRPIAPTAGPPQLGSAAAMVRALEHDQAARSAVFVSYEQLIGIPQGVHVTARSGLPHAF